MVPLLSLFPDLVQTLVVLWIIVGLLACVGALRDVYAPPRAFINPSSSFLSAGQSYNAPSI